MALEANRIKPRSPPQRIRFQATLQLGLLADFQHHVVTYVPTTCHFNCFNSTRVQSLGQP